MKITLCMLVLLSLLFGAGGSFLISISFHNTLEREREAAYNAYQMVLGTLQIMNRINGQSNYAEIAQTLEQLSLQNAGSWTALGLYSATEPVYEFGTAAPARPASPVPPGRCTIRYLPVNQGGQALALSGTLEAGGETLYLDMTRDISSPFEARRVQQRIYQWVFLTMTALCAILSYSIARVLTGPLVSLSRASRAIATGSLGSRAQVSSGDEIGLVARDFNAMAEALEHNILELKESVERQKRFMGGFSHELKTPMTSIIGYADLIRGQTLSAGEQAEAAHYIVQEGKRLENLSQKLLDLLVLEKAGAGLSAASPASLISGIVSHLGPLYLNQGILLACECEEGECLMDPDLVKSLLINLLDNARKAMDGREGRILMRCQMLLDGCRISVQDDGRGIVPEALAHLTEAFYRVDRSRARGQGGVGLGLTLCREIATLHGGSIHFESRVGEGTTVTVELKGGRV